MEPASCPGKGPMTSWCHLPHSDQSGFLMTVKDLERNMTYRASGTTLGSLGNVTEIDMKLMPPVIHLPPVVSGKRWRKMKKIIGICSKFMKCLYGIVVAVLMLSGVVSPAYL